ncbi:hypothetical protein B0T12DRAFT_418172, partial [Alternaria alternata]
MPLFVHRHNVSQSVTCTFAAFLAYAWAQESSAKLIVSVTANPSMVIDTEPPEDCENWLQSSG